MQVPPLLDIEGLTLTLGRRRLLDDVSFSVARGESVALIGPNGAGKTTFLRCLAGIFDRYEGTIRFDGTLKPRRTRKSLARRIAYLQQSPVNGFAFTVRQIVEMGRYPHLAPLAPATEEDDAAVERAMHETGVAEFSSRQIDTLSGGERQKVFLAAALAQEPELLLLDEPTTCLDYRHRREMDTLLRRLHREQGVTILEVTHDVNRALGEAGQVVALKNGRICFDGTPDRLLRGDVLREIYGVDFEWVANPENGRTYVLG